MSNLSNEAIMSLIEQRDSLNEQLRGAKEGLDDLEKEIASLKELIEQAYQYVEYAVTYSTPLSQKLSERWISEVETRREK